MVIEIFKEMGATILKEPWYAGIGMVAGGIITILVFGLILITLPQICKMFFALDLIGFSYYIYTGFSKEFDANTILMLVLLAVCFVILFFMLFADSQVDPDDSFFWIIVSNFFSGLANWVIAVACFTIILIPIAAMAMGRNDRYRGY